jgi:cysteine desulfurase
MKPIYLDYNATTPLDEKVITAMTPYYRDHFGNPASNHVFGRIARDAVEQARNHVTSLIGGREGMLIFTASATEANNQIFNTWIESVKHPCHVVTSMIEHKSVSSPLKYAEDRGRITVTRLHPNCFGQIEPQSFISALGPETRFASIMAANHIIHTINPIGELAAICAQRGILFHSDAAQFVGKMPINVADQHIDALTISSHKMYGPKGIGALYIGPGGLQSGRVPLVRGGGQERGLRAGTLNVPAIVGFGEASRLASRRQLDDSRHTRYMAGLLHDILEEQFPEIRLNGHPENRLPGGLHLTLPGIDAKGLMAVVPEVAFSDGAACDAEDDPDYVVKAIGKPEAAHFSIRLQLGRETTEAEIKIAVEHIVRGIHAMKTFVV